MCQGFERYLDDWLSYLKGFLAIKILRNNANVNKAIVCISDNVRKAIQSRNERVSIGMQSCSVYDQWYVKPCNKCQISGHYAKQWGNAPCCGYCAANDHKSEHVSTKVNLIRSVVITVRLWGIQKLKLILHTLRLARCMLLKKIPWKLSQCKGQKTEKMPSGQLEVSQVYGVELLQSQQ